MSTRSVIARKTREGFTGVYHHFDGYPSGVGAQLYQLYNGHFDKYIKDMMHTLIDEHPAGWSNINGTDFNLDPGFVNHGSSDSNRPQCYCHGDRHEEAHGFIKMQGDNWGTEYAYAIDEQELTMWCYKWVYETQSWHCIAVVDLNGEEPDWKHLDQR